MALSRKAATGLRLLLRSQDIYGTTGWHALSRELHIQASRQIFPACCSLLQPLDGQPAWDDRSWSRGFRSSILVPHSAQPALAQPVEEEQEETRQRDSAQSEAPSTSSMRLPSFVESKCKLFTSFARIGCAAWCSADSRSTPSVRQVKYVDLSCDDWECSNVHQVYCNSCYYTS